MSNFPLVLEKVFFLVVVREAAVIEQLGFKQLPQSFQGFIAEHSLTTDVDHSGQEPGVHMLVG